MGQWETKPSIVDEGIRYIRADAPELLALVEAVRAEIEARNLFLATAPDRGGNHGPKGQRRLALEAAQSATVHTLAAWETITANKEATK